MGHAVDLIGRQPDQIAIVAPFCGSAWKRDPVSGVIGVE
jgi:hypothetical protein